MKSGSEDDRLRALLQGAGLRPTRQRLALARWLFDGCFKHVTAEQVHNAMVRAAFPVSLATVYNTLNSFVTASLLRQVAVDGGQLYFDTNTGDHYHILNEDSGHLLDVPANAVRIASLPLLPAGTKLARIDLVVRVKAE